MSFFVGLTFHPETLAVLSSVQSAFSDTEGVRIVPEEQFHLTLKFLGDLSDEEIAHLDSRLSRIRHPPFSLVLSDVGGFPSLNAPRVLWVGIQTDPFLLDLAKKIDMATQNIARDMPFQPHITIARCRDEALISLKDVFVPGHIFPVDSFTLFQSIMEDDQRRYVCIKQYSLR